MRDESAKQLGVSALRSYVADRSCQWESERAISRQSIAELTDFGVWGALVPREYGGHSRSFEEIVQMAQAMGAESASLLSIFTGHSMVVHAINEFGNSEQKAEWLPKLAVGGIRGAFAITDSASGSDAAACVTKMRDVDGCLSISGEKVWTSSSKYAGLFAVLVKRENGLEMALVPRASLGLEIREQQGMDCFRAAGIGSLEFVSVAVDAKQLIGPSGGGLSIVGISSLNVGRLIIAAGATGGVRACCELAMEHVKKKSRFGELLYKKDLVKRMLTVLRVQYCAADGLCAKACSEITECRESTYTLLIAKYYASKALKECSEIMTQLCGSSAFLENGAVSRVRRDAAAFEIIEGTSQLLELILGTPFQPLK